ncbi:annexin D3 [Momordica charantia]|uniref:Annexin n=1 Tax=Momordica charantia TaxID=3673 RepID=A0A6J1CCG2_MOMCH|nr:annexin D3 [Momordica charantia]
MSSFSFKSFSWRKSKSSKSDSGHSLSPEERFLTENMGTLRVPEIVPSPAEDCDRLKKAFDGWGTDEKVLIRILGQRNAAQRKSIRETYHELYKESLIDRINSELSGDFRKAAILWAYDPTERDARLANEALRSHRKGIHELQVIVEIACATSPNHLIAVRQAYCSLFDCSLEEDIFSTISMPLRKLLVGLVSSFRHDKEVVDNVVADSEADLLHNAIKAKQLNRSGVVWILSTRNFFQLRATFACYKQKYGNPIDQDIMKCGSSDLESLFKVAIWCIETPEKHFAKVINKAIVGLGTDEDSLTRAIIGRAEIDAMKVREEYSNMFKSNLDKDVIGDTSGDYKDMLMILLGAKV